MQKTSSHPRLPGAGSTQAASNGEVGGATPASSLPPPPLHRRTSSGVAAGSGTAAAVGPLLTPGSWRPSSGGVVPQRQQVEQELVYEKLPADIAERYVMLMDPILGSGNSAARAIQASGRLRSALAYALLVLCQVAPAAVGGRA